eukprot:7253123-Pyramimonas_sp.AAC.1
MLLWIEVLNKGVRDPVRYHPGPPGSASYHDSSGRFESDICMCRWHDFAPPHVREALHTRCSLFTGLMLPDRHHRA